MSDKILTIYKKSGLTPLDCVAEVKKSHPEWQHMPMTYAGRLDPMAEGLLLILVGDECLKKDEYLALNKEYEVTVLFGFATDTYDLLGKVISKSKECLAQVLGSPSVGTGPDHSLNHSFDFENALKNFTGRISQAYPPYSSRTVDGKPLYQWAREGRINEIAIPSHDVFVESIEILNENKISKTKLARIIKEKIANVKGDFRQEEILGIWNEKLSAISDTENFKTITLKINCGSGVYVRSIAHNMGIELGIPALAMKIVRTKIGEYKSCGDGRNMRPTGAGTFRSSKLDNEKSFTSATQAKQFACSSPLKKQKRPEGRNVFTSGDGRS